jgi:hypothetical protein
MVDADRQGSFAVTRSPAALAGGEVCMLLGWALSTDRQTRHYAGLLHELGVGTVLRATAGPYDTFFSRPGRRRLAEEALDALAAHAAGHPGRPAWLFLMSNGGAFVYEEMLDALRSDGSDGTGGGGGAAAAAGGPRRRWGGVRLAGAVFDSAPAALTVRSASLGMTEFIRTPALRHAAYAAAYALHATVLPPAPHNDAFFKGLRADTLPLPALYIYSDDDVVTDAATLSEFVAWRRAHHPLGDRAGSAVHELHITAPSAHVSHYRAHKERYVGAVRGFLAAARDGFAAREGGAGGGGGGVAPVAAPPSSSSQAAGEVRA